MTIKIETIDEVVSVALDDMSDWQEFATDNLDALVDRYGSIHEALLHLVHGGLVLGGGASPEVTIYFAEAA